MQLVEFAVILFSTLAIFYVVWDTIENRHKGGDSVDDERKR